jgi:hypothetical protein
MILSCRNFKIYYPICDTVEITRIHCIYAWFSPERSTAIDALTAALEGGWKLVPTLKGDKLICPCCAKKGEIK